MVTFAYSVFEASIISIFAYFGHMALLDQVGIDINWIVFAIAGLLVIQVLTYFEISLAAKVLTFLLGTEIAILAIMGFGVLFHGGGPDGLMPESEPCERVPAKRSRSRRSRPRDVHCLLVVDGVRINGHVR